MTREQIIAAAKEAGFTYRSVDTWGVTTTIELERFYTIVANQTKEQCAALCYEQNWLILGEEMAALILATKVPE